MVYYLVCSSDNLPKSGKSRIEPNVQSFSKWYWAVSLILKY